MLQKLRTMNMRSDTLYGLLFKLNIGETVNIPSKGKKIK